MVKAPDLPVAFGRPPGSIAVMSAATGDFAAASVNYGLVPKDTAKLSAICPVVGSYGANDTRFLPDAARLERTLTELGVPHDVEVYEGAGHSFLNRSVPAFISKRTASVGYAPDQAEHAFARIFAFFDTHLGKAVAPSPDPADVGPPLRLDGDPTVLGP